MTSLVVLRCVTMTAFFFVLLCLTNLIVLSEGATATNNNEQQRQQEQEQEQVLQDYLTENSVVLITGAAGFLGSELALALHRTYGPKKIICVDRMGDHPQTQEELALFEFQRQRAFHVLQTLGARGRFYRVDFRPMIPEYFDMGEVPILDHIFREHTDISHVVHLADPFPHAALQVIPREKEVPKAGMLEALMEQLHKVQREGGRVPHFTYASSYEVYPKIHNNTGSPFTETQPLSTPSSLRGASKLIDEILAKMYHDMHDIYSVGLRFFSVYGPWSVPGSPLFEMAERAVTGDKSLWDAQWKNVRDYVYIDDAIDAMMAAMQFRPIGNNPPPVVFNVATEEGASLEDIAKIMEEYFPRSDQTSIETGSDAMLDIPTVSYGSTKRAEQLLGYKPLVPLRDGIVQLLAWHYDRANPYGGHQDLTNEKSRYVASKGIVSCRPTDKECLKAAPVFPCASECSHEAQCTTSYYDDLVGWTQALTAECETVLYTVDLSETLEFLPSVHVKIHRTSKSFVDGTCNLAFVSDVSPLSRSLNSKYRVSSFLGSGRGKLIRHGEWILVPVNIPTVPTGEDSVLSLLPKLSPGLFFGSRTTRAIYIDPDILLDSIPKLLREASMQPFSEEIEGATAMLIGKGKPKDYFAEAEDFLPKPQVLESTKAVVQKSAYRMVRVAVSDKLFGDGFAELLDSRWIVHTLQSDDSRLFRCDVFGEVVQWEVETDQSALEFVLGLHDMWSRVIASESGTAPWWTGDSVVTVPEGRQPYRRRRLQQEQMEGAGDDDNEEQEEEGKGGKQEYREPGGDDDVTELRGEIEREQAGAELANGDDDASLADDTIPEEDEKTGGFLKAGEGEVNTAGDEKRGASSEQDDDDELTNEEYGGSEQEEDINAQSDVTEHDFSSYDAWMGVLSATSVKYFVRIVPSSEVGIVSLDEFDKQTSPY